MHPPSSSSSSHPGPPHSLFLHTRETHPFPYRSHQPHPVEDTFQRRNLEHKQAMKKELDGWMDLLMESESVSREMFKRASLYLRPQDYTEITHERHLTSLCSYPLCPLPPFRKFSSASRYSFVRQSSHNTTLSRAPTSNNATSSSRRLIEQEEGNTHEGFCTPTHQTLSNFYQSQLSEDPPWAREDLRPGDLGRFKSKALGGQEDAERRLRGREVRLGDEVVEEVEAVKEGRDGDGRVGQEEGAGAGVLRKKELVVETRREYSSFEEELNKTLEGLRIVEKHPQGENVTNPASVPEPSSPIKQDNPSPSNPPTTRNPPPLHPLPYELLPLSNPSSTSKDPKPLSRAMQVAGYEEFDEEDEEDDEVRRVFEEAMEARELLRGEKF